MPEDVIEILPKISHLWISFMCLIRWLVSLKTTANLTSLTQASPCETMCHPPASKQVSDASWLVHFILDPTCCRPLYIMRPKERSHFEFRKLSQHNQACDPLMPFDWIITKTGHRFSLMLEEFCFFSKFVILWLWIVSQCSSQWKPVKGRILHIFIGKLTLFSSSN